MRRPFGAALDSFSSLKTRISSRLRQRLRDAEDLLQSRMSELSAALPNFDKPCHKEASKILAALSYPSINGVATACDPILRERCPLCFGGVHTGKNPYAFFCLSRAFFLPIHFSFPAEADIHVSVDGNFNHRHLKTAGKGRKLHESEYFIPQHVIDKVEARMNSARSKGQKSYTPKVPDTTLDMCKASFKAAHSC